MSLVFLNFIMGEPTTQVFVAVYWILVDGKFRRVVASDLLSWFSVAVGRRKGTHNAHPSYETNTTHKGDRQISEKVDAGVRLTLKFPRSSVHRNYTRGWFSWLSKPSSNTDGAHHHATDRLWRKWWTTTIE